MKIASFHNRSLTFFSWIIIMFLWLKIVGMPLQIIWLQSKSVISLSNCIDSGFKTVTAIAWGFFRPRKLSKNFVKKAKNWPCQNSQWRCLLYFVQWKGEIFTQRLPWFCLPFPIENTPTLGPCLKCLEIL